MIALLSHRCRAAACRLGWVATMCCDTCPFCGSREVLVGGAA